MTAQACLNGWRTPSEFPGLPVTPGALAAEALAAVRAGADSIHLHPKDAEGHDSLAPEAVAAALDAVRDLAGSVPVGVTTGIWASDDPEQRRRLIADWTVLPDFASVNWHEPGSPDLADLLLARGVGLEAGLHTPDAVRSWALWPHRDETMRVLLEVVEARSADDAVTQTHALLAAFGDAAVDVPVLLHGEEVGCWPVFDVAIGRGLGWRIGLEDTLVLPDGTPAGGNAALVAAALARRG